MAPKENKVADILTFMAPKENKVADILTFMAPKKIKVADIEKKTSGLAEKFIEKYDFIGFEGQLFPVYYRLPHVTTWELNVSAGEHFEKSLSHPIKMMCGIYVSTLSGESVRIDENDKTIQSFFPVDFKISDREFYKEMLGSFTKLKKNLSEIYASFLETKINDVKELIRQNPKYGGTEEQCMEECESNLVLIGTLWKNKEVSATVGSFQMQNEYDATFISSPSEVDNCLLSAYLCALQLFNQETHFVEFPGKSSSELAAQFLYYLWKNEISPLSRVELIAIGDTDVGKTTIFRNIMGEPSHVKEREGFQSTHWYDIYTHIFEYSPEEILSYNASTGDKNGNLYSPLTPMIWDLGGQHGFWGRVLGRSNLPLNLIPEIGKIPFPHVIELVYSADKYESLDKLREYVKLCKEKFGPGVYDSSYKILFRTKIDVCGKVSDEEMKSIASEFGAESYAQINSLKDKDLIAATLKNACAVAYCRWSVK